MRTIFFVLGLTVLATWNAGCGKTDRSKAPLEDRVTTVPDDDGAMATAIGKARASVGEFTAALKVPRGQSEFAVKMPFSDPGVAGGEHMWVTPVTFDGKVFTGTLNNEPDHVKSVKLGQTVSMAPDRISDWMYREKGKIVGAYTLRVLRNTLNDADKKDFDREFQFKD